MVPYAQFPKYFEIYGRKEPQGLNHVPTTFAYGTPELSYYEMISRDPERMKAFMKAMAPLEEKMPIAGIYDFSWLVEKARDQSAAERTMFVDVGGGKGTAIKAIHNEFPGLPLDRFVLQDREEVVAAMKELDDPALKGVTPMVIDFHENQPVKGMTWLVVFPLPPSPAGLSPWPIRRRRANPDGCQVLWCTGSGAASTTMATKPVLTSCEKWQTRWRKTANS